MAKRGRKRSYTIQTWILGEDVDEVMDNMFKRLRTSKRRLFPYRVVYNSPDCTEVVLLSSKRLIGSQVTKMYKEKIEQEC